MRNWLSRKWRARGDRHEELATVRGMLKASEARNVELAERMATMESQMADLKAFLQRSVIVGRA